MADATTTAIPTKKPRKPAGPRKPQPLYVFAKTDETGKINVTNSYRDARKMAESIQAATANGEQLLVVLPE